MARLTTTSQLRREWAPACRITPVTIAFHGDGRATVRAEVAEAFRALNACLVAWDYRTRRADTGGYVCRTITGGTGVSPHGLGVAVDIRWQTNPYGPTLITDMPRGMVAAIKAIRTRNGVHVFRWGGDYTGNKDAMHYEVLAQRHDLATGIDPATVPGSKPATPTTPPPPPPPKGLTMDPDVTAAFDRLGKGIVDAVARLDRLEAELLKPIGTDGSTRADRMAALPGRVDALERKLDTILALLRDG